MKNLSVFLIFIVFIPGFNSKSNSAEDDYLYYLCKVWGLLKYHHPNVAVGTFDWDHELFVMAEKSQTVDNIKGAAKSYTLRIDRKTWSYGLIGGNERKRHNQLQTGSQL